MDKRLGGPENNIYYINIAIFKQISTYISMKLVIASWISISALETHRDWCRITNAAEYGPALWWDSLFFYNGRYDRAQCFTRFTFSRAVLLPLIAFAASRKEGRVAFIATTFFGPSAENWIWIS